MTDYDVIIVGSGAGGGTIASVLAGAGKRILILERGPFLPREPANWSPHEVFHEGRYVSPDVWTDSAFRQIKPQAHYFVGGATKVYGAALFRLRPRDFTRYERADGVSPAWPLSYEQMEPWYTEAEWLYQVHGEHGADPTEGYASKNYPYPPVSHEERIETLSQDLAGAGLHPFPAPCGVLLDEDQPWASACVRCHLCDGFPCPVRGKADAQTICIDPILSLPNVTLRTGCRVLRFLPALHDRRTVASVEYEDPEGPPGPRPWIRRATAGIFVLSAGAVNSAVILLASGLANSSGMVGRNYMCHNSEAVIALSHSVNETRFQKTLAVHDFYDQWGSIQMLGKTGPDALKAGGMPAQLMPNWSADAIASHAVDFWLMTEDLPQPRNQVTLNGRQPVLTVRQTGGREMEYLCTALRDTFATAGMMTHARASRSMFLRKGMPLAAVAHQAGTARFGTDPAASVLDVNCRAHDLGNLYVVDASFMPSVGAVNPALTIMANALRVGDHIARE